MNYRVFRSETGRSPLGLAHRFLREIGAGRSGYPVFRRELRYWDDRLGGRWRFGEAFGLLALASLCLLPATLMMFPHALALHIFLVELVGAFVTLPAAAVIVRERTDRTWDVLRTTQLSNLEIAVGKLSGVLYLVWEGLRYLVFARLIGVLLTVPLFALLFFLPVPRPLSPDATATFWTGALLASMLAFLYQPYLNAICGACVGLAASTLAATSGRAVALGMAVQGLSSLSAGCFLFWFQRAAVLETLFASGVLGGRLQEVFAWLLPLSGIIAVRLLLTLACFGLAHYRIGKLLQ